MTAPSASDLRYTATIDLGFPVDVRATLAALQRGPTDPWQCVGADGTLWRSARLPSGVVVAALSQSRLESVCVEACGPGAEQFIEELPAFLGMHDSPEAFDPHCSYVAALWRRAPKFRVPRTLAVVDQVVPAVIEQRVTGQEAIAAFSRLARAAGTAVTTATPRPLHYPPTVEQWLSLPSWQWHQAGVDPRRRRTAQALLRLGDELNFEARRGNINKVYRLMRSVHGAGAWTAAEVGYRALGDADAIPWGDYHLGRVVGWSLTGAVVALDEVAPLVVPWAPQRYRLWRVLRSAPNNAPPRKGPRITIADHRRR